MLGDVMMGMGGVSPAQAVDRAMDDSSRGLDDCGRDGFEAGRSVHCYPHCPSPIAPSPVGLCEMAAGAASAREALGGGGKQERDDGRVA